MPHSTPTTRIARPRSRRGPRTGGRPNPTGSVGRFYARAQEAGAPIPLTFHETSTQVGSYGESNPTAGADTSGLAPTYPVALTKRTLKAADPSASEEDTLSFPTMLHAYVYKRVLHKKHFPRGLRTALRAMPTEELERTIRSREAWNSTLLAYGSSLPHDHPARTWKKTDWKRFWCQEWTPAWYRHPSGGGVSKAQKAWYQVAKAAAAQHPDFARLLCSTGTRTLGLRQSAAANPVRLMANASRASDDSTADRQITDSVHSDGQPGAYGRALMQLRTELRTTDPDDLGALPDAFEPYEKAPHGLRQSPPSSPPYNPPPTPPASSDEAEAQGDDDDDDDAMDIVEADRPSRRRLRDERALAHCATCQAPAPPLACEGCFQRAYCSIECQRRHWEAATDAHAEECARLVEEHGRPAVTYEDPAPLPADDPRRSYL